MTRSRSLIGIGSIAALFLGAGSAQADFIVDHDGPLATGIRNLDVDGTLYDVLFLFESAEDLWGGPDPVFDFITESDALNAVLAVNAALNSVPEVEEVGRSIEEGSGQYAVPFDFEDPDVSVQESFYFGDPLFWLDDGINTLVLDQRHTYADFTPVPAPGAMAVCLGAFLFGCGRRRRTSC